MCLPNFIRFENILENEPLTGYRSWLNYYDNPLTLKSINQNYTWDKIIEGPHEVLDKDSGIYAYNYNYYNNYYNYNYNNYNYNNNNYNYNYNYYNYYNLSGIIHQWGKVAIHKTGYRSEYSKIITLFTIRESDAKGPEKFLNWIKGFNNHIGKLAEKYQANTIHWQDFIENQK